jgi:hypothetical protein
MSTPNPFHQDPTESTKVFFKLYGSRSASGQMKTGIEAEGKAEDLRDAFTKLCKDQPQIKEIMIDAIMRNYLGVS